MRNWMGIGFLVVLSGCSSAQVAKGQLFCVQATATGPLVVALADSLGAPVIATGTAAAVVKADCAAIQAIPVTPPASGTAPVVATVLPAVE